MREKQQATSKNIGRFALLKYYLVFIVIAMSIPVIIELIQWKSTDILAAVVEAFKLRSIDGGEILFLFIHVIVLLIGIWFFGGIAGKAIIEKRKSKFAVSFKAIFKLWMLYFFSASIITVTTKNDQTALNLIINGMVTILHYTVIAGVVHGLVAGYFMGKEIERKGL